MMSRSAVTFGFMDELSKLAADQASYDEEQDRPSFGKRLKKHFQEYGPTYLGAAAAAAASQGLYHGAKKYWPAIKAHSGKGLKAVGNFGLRMAPWGVGAYAIGRGLKAGERERDRETLRDVARAEQAQGRYTPYTPQ